MQMVLVVLGTLSTLSGALLVQEPKNVVFTPPRSGIFCRGNGCPYAETGTIGGQNVLGHAGSVQDVKQQAEAALAMGMDALLARKEFCRGMSCVDGMGKPVDRTKAAFVAQCSHFFVAGGLEGQDDYRSVKNVYDSFGSICGPRVGYSELPFCRAYGDVVAAALASQMEATTVGSAEKICDTLFDFTLEIKQAQVDLELFEGSLDLASEMGPGTARGQRWAKQLDLSSSAASPNGSSQLQVATDLQNGTAEDKYQVTMPSWDGGLNATKVAPQLFEHCELEMREIMADESQTAGRVSKLAVDWCNFQQLQGGRGKQAEKEKEPRVWKARKFQPESSTTKMPFTRPPPPPPPIEMLPEMTWKPQKAPERVRVH